MTVKQLTAPTTIRIEPELKVWLLQKAHIEKRNLSNLINYLLERIKTEEYNEYVLEQNIIELGKTI